MNEQNDHIWMHKKPETVFDWLAIIAISIALYLMLGHLNCLLYTSPSPRDKRQSRMPSSA